MSADAVVRPIVELECPDWCTDEHGIAADGACHRTDIAKFAWGRVEVNWDIEIDGGQILVHPLRIVVAEDGKGRGSLDALEARELAAAICKASDLVDQFNVAVLA